MSQPDLDSKLAVIQLGWDLTKSNTLLAGLLGGFVLTLATHGTDQDLAQRFLTCRDARRGSYSLLASACVLVPMMLLFLVVGTLLYYFYAGQQAAYPLPADLNHLFPTFIVQELPVGFRGFVMAGILAASLSSLTSALNALASTTIADVYRPLRERLSLSRGAQEQTHLLRASRGITLVWGGVLVLVALAFVGNKGNVLTLALQALTYFYGALLGVFLLGLFTSRGSRLSVVTGMLAGVVAVLLLQARQFIAAPEAAPAIIRRLLLEPLPESAHNAVLDTIPELAWPYWIIVGASITVGIGSVGRARPEST
jgi:Na+/proline symporter